MIKTTKILQNELACYSDPKNKIARMVNDGQLTRIVNGLYETNSSADPLCLAASICGPSYISFETALSYYGLIPESAKAITSASFEKEKNKHYSTPFGEFLFQDVSSSAFPFEIDTKVSGDYAYRIATPEKALCDLLSKRAPAANERELRVLLFEDLRLDPQQLLELDADKVEKLSYLYKSRNVKRFSKLIKRSKADGCFYQGYA